jgi:vacuolar-type H+-ATPase subunit E/Vma4
MSPERNGIEALESAIMEEAHEQARRILADARARVDSLHQQAKTEMDAERERALQRARQETKTLRSQASAAAQLEAQALRLRRREQLLERVVASAMRRLASAPQWPDYEHIALRLLREPIAYLGADEIVVRADRGTRRVLTDEVLTGVGEELGVRLRPGAPLGRGTGVILETPDGHRRYDNTLETRLARMKDDLRAPIYHILMGRTA